MTQRNLRESDLADFDTHHIEGFARAAMEKGKDGHFDTPLVSKVADNLYVGGCRNGIRLPDTFKYVVSLYPWVKYRVGSKTSYVEVEMLDSGTIPDEGMLHGLADLVNTLSAKGQTLVHCQAGLNRSNLVTALALMKRGQKAADVIAHLRAQRSPVVLCNQAFENWLLAQDAEEECSVCHGMYPKPVEYHHSEEECST